MSGHPIQIPLCSITLKGMGQREGSNMNPMISHRVRLSLDKPYFAPGSAEPHRGCCKAPRSLERMQNSFKTHYQVVIMKPKVVTIVFCSSLGLYSFWYHPLMVSPSAVCTSHTTLVMPLFVLLHFPSKLGGALRSLPKGSPKSPNLDTR